MRQGVRICCDVGTVRVGLARCDSHGLLASPLPAVAAQGAIAAVADLVHEVEAIEVVVGLPLRLDGSTGPAAEQARDWASSLRQALAASGSSAEVNLVDERLTTVQAQRRLHDAGRNTRSSRRSIDSAAAVVLLQGHLDQIRGQSTGGAR
ncbi:MAG: Holliday junction resolvase RuvX [Actinomycetales bacterium]